MCILYALCFLLHAVSSIRLFFIKRIHVELLIFQINIFLEYQMVTTVTSLETKNVPLFNTKITDLLVGCAFGIPMSVLPLCLLFSFIFNYCWLHVWCLARIWMACGSSHDGLAFFSPSRYFSCDI